MEEHVTKVLRQYGEINWLRSDNVKYFNDKTKGSNRLEDEILQLYENKEMVFLNCLSLQIQRFKETLN